MGSSIEVEVGPEGVVILNESDVPTKDILPELSRQAPLVAALVRWSQGLKGRQGSLFERDRFVGSDRIFDQYASAYYAAENDDIVSGFLDTSEAMAFRGVGIEVGDEDEDEAMLWNQVAHSIDLDARLREMWREVMITSNVNVGIVWSRQDIKLEGRTKGKDSAGAKRRKVYSGLTMPKALTVFDPFKCIPVGNTMFDQERIAYLATRDEASIIMDVLNGDRQDPVLRQLFEAPYEVTSPIELRELGALGVRFVSGSLFLFRRSNIFRHTVTRSRYQRFPVVRMKSLFELLDLKMQLRQLDRAMLLGATNFILLIRKGSDDKPATPEELTSLRDSVQGSSRTPVIVGDHRLQIDIIQPKVDSVLDEGHYQVLDGRITARLYNMIVSGAKAAGAGQRTDTSISAVRAVGMGLEARRYMLKLDVEKAVLGPAYEANEVLGSKPRIAFHPKRIALDFDPNLIALITSLHERGDLSRASILEEADFDEETEWRRRKYEKENYDDVFQSGAPFSSPLVQPFNPQNPQNPRQPRQPQTPAQPQPQSPRSAGRTQGGNRNGGGANTGPAKLKPKPAPTPRRPGSNPSK